MAPSSVAELKAKLKELGMSQAGDKGTLEHRVKKGTESVRHDLRTPDGDPVHTLKIAKLKKHAAKAGISPIGTLDEIMFAYVDFLTKNVSAASTDGAGGPENEKSSTRDEKSNVAKRLSAKVITLAEHDDFVGILNLGGVDVTASSSAAILRKAYLKLSLVLHPDKNRDAPDPTKVFQTLVNAYERLTRPELVEDAAPVAKKGAKRRKAISRSNVGCERTRVCCPRCESPWSESSSVEGNPEYCYNFLMMGVRSYTCATCLLEFGCMTAVHRCPHCDRTFEYHPDDYHRKIKCGNAGCDKEFGFYLYHVSDRATKETKTEVRRLRERAVRVTEQKRRRAEALRRRRGAAINDDDAEMAFSLGLANECPRCGASLADLADEDEISHLRDCRDDVAIRAHSKRKAAAERETNERRGRRTAQEDVASRAAWDFLGGANRDAWLLTDGALRKECAERGVNAEGKETHEMIAGLTSKRARSRALTKLDDGGAQKKSSPGDDDDDDNDTLPSNLHSMTVAQLRAVAAARGVVVGSRARKCDVIDLLERSTERENDDHVLAITGTGEKGASGARATNKEIVEVDSGSESEYEDED